MGADSRGEDRARVRAVHHNMVFSDFAIKLLVTACLSAFGGGEAPAHTIPSLTVEAMFEPDREYVLTVNVDPRLFLHEQPAEHPPVAADWFREMQPDQVNKASADASAYLRKAMELRFGGEPAGFPEFSFQPIDGSTNRALDAESTEVHLLATVRGNVPPGRRDFQLMLGRDANTSLILLKSFGGQAERRPSVLFPGETSLPFLLNYPDEVPPPRVVDAITAEPPAGDAGAVEAKAAERSGFWSAAVLGAVVCVLASLWRLKRPRGR